MMLNFEVNGLKETKEKLDNYYKSIEKRAELFISKLLDKGIQIANLYKTDIKGDGGTQGLGQYVTFTKEVDGKSGTLIGIDVPITSFWKNKSGTHEAIVFPLLMLEFGSAFYADPPQSRFGGSGGKGTMAISGHENDVEWWYTDLDGKPHKNYSIRPTSPMYNAWKEMYLDMKQIAKEVYGNGK
jgi:hypothetical protein